MEPTQDDVGASAVFGPAGQRGGRPRPVHPNLVLTYEDWTISVIIINILDGISQGLMQNCNQMHACYLFQQDKHYDLSYDTGDKALQCGRHVDIFKLWLMWRAKVKNDFLSFILFICSLVWLVWFTQCTCFCVRSNTIFITGYLPHFQTK